MKPIVFAYKLVLADKTIQRRTNEMALMRDLDSRVCDEFTLKELKWMTATSHIPLDETIEQKILRKQGRQN